MEIFNDFDTTIKKALAEIDPNWESYDGLIICGTHSPKNWEEQMEKIREARESGIPFLGVCFGYQISGIEYARNVLGITDATSEEFGEEGRFVVRKLAKLNVGLKDGESWWNNYEVVPEVESIWTKPENFFIAQYHPEYQSSVSSPHPLLVKFLDYAKMAV